MINGRGSHWEYIHGRSMHSVEWSTSVDQFMYTLTGFVSGCNHSCRKKEDTVNTVMSNQFTQRFELLLTGVLLIVKFLYRLLITRKLEDSI